MRAEEKQNLEPLLEREIVQGAGEKIAVRDGENIQDKTPEREWNEQTDN